MAAVRNRIAHGYFGLDDLLLFETIETQLTRLLPRLEAWAPSIGARIEFDQGYAALILPATALIFLGDACQIANPDTTLTPAPSQNANV